MLQLNLKIESKLIDALTCSPNFESNSGPTNLQFPWITRMENSLPDSLTAGSSAGKSELLERTLESENKPDVKTGSSPMSNRARTFDRSLPPLCHPFQTAHHLLLLLLSAAFAFNFVFRGNEFEPLFELSYRANYFPLTLFLFFSPFSLPYLPSLSILRPRYAYSSCIVDKIHFSFQGCKEDRIDRFYRETVKFLFYVLLYSVCRLNRIDETFSRVKQKSLDDMLRCIRFVFVFVLRCVARSCQF